MLLSWLLKVIVMVNSSVSYRLRTVSVTLAHATSENSVEVVWLICVTSGLSLVMWVCRCVSAIGLTFVRCL